MDLKLTGKVALVTGSSQGLGFATAKILAQEGVDVTINGRNDEKLAVAANLIADEKRGKVLPIVGDLIDPKTPEKLVSKVIKEFGRLDLLVTNAGGPPPGRFESFNDDDWYKAIDLSFMCHVRLIRASLPYLRKSKFASVLTITSYSVKQPIQNLVLSNSIRAATVGLTKSLALELGRDGIRFNSILPGWTKTERVIELMGARARANNTTIEDEIAKREMV